MFPAVQVEVEDDLVRHAETNQAYQRSYDNNLLGGEVFYAHPSFMRSGVRVDQLTARADLSQADMYRMMLRLPPGTSLAKPKLPRVDIVPMTVLVIPAAVSWPNTQSSFWSRLVSAFQNNHTGWRVTELDSAWSLEELFMRCASSEWAIGPQCGVMSILATGQFPCRKTFATPSIDDNDSTDYWAEQTYPYGYVTKFAGEDHDVEEYKITNRNHAEVIAAILNGVNARRLWRHSPAPVTSVNVPLSPGDFLDRLAVLTVKHERFDSDKRALIEREYQRYVEARRYLNAGAAANRMYDGLLKIHRTSFDLLQRTVPRALSAGEMSAADHVEMIKLNRERVLLKNEIDAVCHAPYAEVKSYYG